MTYAKPFSIITIHLLATLLFSLACSSWSGGDTTGPVAAVPVDTDETAPAATALPDLDATVQARVEATRRAETTDETTAPDLVPVNQSQANEDASPVDPSGKTEIVAAADTGDPIYTDSALYLVLGAWEDADGNGQADFWSDSGGVGARGAAEEGLGQENYDTVTNADCQKRHYYGDMPYDPNNHNTYCFITDGGLVGKFRVLSQDADGGLNIQYTIWGDPIHPVPAITTIEPAGQPGLGSARPWPPGSEAAAQTAAPAYTVVLGDTTYEAWGQPQHANGCGGPYFDNHPMRNFKVYVTLTNQADQAIAGDWFPYFTSASEAPLSSCYWTDHNRQVSPGQSTTVVWGTFVEPDDWVTGIHFTQFNQPLSFCFNQAGQETSCH